MKLTEEQKQTIKRQNQEELARAIIWRASDKLYPSPNKKEPSLIVWIGFVMAICGAFLAIFSVADDNSTLIYIAFGFVFTGILPLIVQAWKYFRQEYRRGKWEKQALADWEQTGELPEL